LAGDISIKPEAKSDTRRLYGDITGVGDGFTIIQTSPEAKCGEISAAQR
jgi:hypothetical protein